MSHLREAGLSYLNHLIRAWRLSFVLFVHGLFPNIWKTKASEEICKDNSTRKYLLDTHYGIREDDIMDRFVSNDTYDHWVKTGEYVEPKIEDCFFNIKEQKEPEPVKKKKKKSKKKK